MTRKGPRKHVTERGVPRRGVKAVVGRDGDGGHIDHSQCLISDADFASPPHWPLDVTFLAAHSLPSSRLPPRIAQQLCVPPRTSHPCHPAFVRAQGWAVVRRITEQTSCKPPFDPAEHNWSRGPHLTRDVINTGVEDEDSRKPYHHPALGQCGLFARRDIPPRTLVVVYLGRAHESSAEDEDSESCYDAAVQATDEDGKVVRCGIDATHAGSEARFVNDYRGILDRPNLFFDDWKAAFPRDSVMPVEGQYMNIDERGASQSSVVDDKARQMLRPCEPPSHVNGLALYSGAHPVKAGIELCASYGKGWWAARRSQMAKQDGKVE